MKSIVIIGLFGLALSTVACSSNVSSLQGFFQAGHVRSTPG